MLALMVVMALSGVAPLERPVKSVAVLEFQGESVPIPTLRALTDAARAAARRTLPRDEYLIMTRENLVVLLRENGVGCSGEEGECEVETGRNIGAQLVFSGEVLKVGKKYVLSLKLHETDRGALLAADDVTGPSEEAIYEGMEPVVVSMLQMGLGRARPAPVAAVAPQPAPVPVAAPAPQPAPPPAAAPQSAPVVTPIPVVLGQPLQRPQDCVDDISCAKMEQCNKGEVKACTTLLKLVVDEDKNTAVGEARVIRVMEKACNLGADQECMGLGWALRNATYVQKDPERALALIQKRCDAGSVAACGDLSNVYLLGQERPKDLSRAFALQRRACELEGDQSGMWCSLVVMAYEIGTNGAPKDPAKAIQYAERACRLKSPNACQHLADLKDPKAAKERTNKESLQRMENGCKEGNVQECVNLAGALDTGYLGRTNKKRALRLYEDACEQKSAHACMYAGLKLASDKDHAGARALYKKGCLMGGQESAGSCVQMAMMYEFGLNVSKKPRVALKYYRRACDAGDTNACKKVRELEDD